MRTQEYVLSEIKQTAQELSELFEEFCKSDNLQPIQNKLNELLNKQILKRWAIYPKDFFFYRDRCLVITTPLIETPYCIKVFIWRSGRFKIYKVDSLSMVRKEIV